ncbi:MAG: hypothetical protein KBD26_02925 [Candidatus Pacebacteria bacterium]|nr:hypothetical protein [Candidatus Paceibacterota bacterium]MBP9772763.1 hypothetical protein [Candidatus Paceibacterota bacterium]
MANTNTQVQPTLLNEEKIGSIKKRIRKTFSNVDLSMVKNPVTNMVSLKVKYNFKDAARVKKACDDLMLQYKEEHNAMIEVIGYFENPEVNKIKVVSSKEEDTILDEIILPEIQDESVETVAAEEVEIEEVGSSDVNQVLEIPEVASDLLKVFYIPKENVCDCDQVTLRLSFDLTKRADSVKFTELTLFCSLINGDGSAFLVEKNDNFGEVIVDCDKLRIPVSATFRPIRKKALECLLEEQGIFFNRKNGNLESKPISDDNNMRMVLNFKSDRITLLDKFKKRLQESGFRLSFVNENAQSILIINYRFVEKSIAYFELIERSEPGYLKGRFLGALGLKPHRFYVNDKMWYITIERGANYEDLALKLMDAGYKYVTANKKHLMLPSLNPVSDEIMPREIPDSQKSIHEEEKESFVTVVRTVLQKKTDLENRPTAIARIAGLMKGLTDDEAHKLLDKFEEVVSGKYQHTPKSLPASSGKGDPVEDRRRLKRLISDMVEKGLIVLDPDKPLGVSYDSVKMLPGNRWKVMMESAKSMSPTEILRFIGVVD